MILLLSFLIVGYSSSYAQSVTWGPTNPAGSGNNISVYSEATTATFEFTNDGTALTDATIEVNLGTGIEYLEGGLVFSTSGSAIVTEGCITGDNPAVFNIGKLDIGERVTITFDRTATCAARDHKSAGGTFTDVGHVFESGTEVTYSNNGASPFSATYDVTYGNLVLGTVTQTPGSATAVGGVINRSLNITNGSFGSINEFWYEDVFSATGIALSNFEINGVVIPTANITQNSGQVIIHFDAALIALIDGAAGTNGNANALFEKDEFFTISYDVTPLTCGSDNTQPSALKAYYGKDVNTECAPSGTGSTSVTLTNGTPLITLQAVTNERVDICLTSTHSVRITNNGVAADDFAKDLVVFMALRYNYSAVSTLSNITMWGGDYQGTRQFSNFTIDGNPLPTSQIAGLYSTMIDYLPPNFLTSDPDAAGSGLEDLDADGFYDDLGPGESIVIGFDITTDPIQHACGEGRVDYMKWEHISADVAWQNQCGADQVPLRQEFSYRNFIRNYISSTFVEGPSDVNDGDNFDVKIKPHLSNSLGCNGGDGLTGADVTWTVKCVLPPGVSLQANPAIDDTSLPYAPTIYQSNDTAYYTINRYQYEWFTFPLTLDCSLWDGSNPISFDFITTYECGTCYKDDIHCESFLTIPHCPSPCTGVTTDDFDIVRTTPGWTDATMTTPVSLTDGVHALDKILPFDTIQLTAKGHVSDTITDNLFLRLEYTPDFGGNIFDYIEGEITFYDLDGAYGNTEYTFPISTAPTVTAVTASTFNWLLDLSSYHSMIDPSYVIGEGMEADSFKVVLKAVFNQNTGPNYYSVSNFRAFFFMNDDVPSERGCNSYGAPLFYNGFSLSSSGNQVTLKGCNEIYLRTYATWYNYAGDIFPDEYRPIEQLDSVVVDLPDGVEVTNITANSYSNGTATYYIDANGMLVIKPNSDYSPRDWTTISYPGFDIYVTGTCELDPGIHIYPVTQHRTLYNYHPDPAVHETNIESNNTTPRFTYIEPAILATPLGQIQQGIADTIAWEVEICNSTSDLGVEYSWITYDESASNGIEVVRVADITSGSEVAVTPVDLTGGLYLIQTSDLAGGECRTVRLYATYTDCAPDDLPINYGWDCHEYPTDIASLPECAADNFLRVVPEDAQMASTITPLATTPADPLDPAAGNYGQSTVDMCDPFPVEYTIISSGGAIIYDINFDIIIPDLGAGLTYIPNSATIEVEGIDLPNTPRPIDPAGEAAFAGATGAVWNITLAELDAANFANNGLTGAGTNALQNEVTVRWLLQPECPMTSGEKLSIQTFGNAPCSDVATGNGEKIVSSDLKINGVTLPYTTILTSSFSPDEVFSGCGDTKTIDINAKVSGGTTASTDSLFVTLSEGLSFNGSLNCTSVNCPTFVEVRSVLGRDVVVFYYPGGLVNPDFNIDFEVTSTDNSTCAAATTEIKSTAQIGGLFCDLVACPSSKVITGVVEAGSVLEKPEFSLDFTTLTYNINTQMYEYTLEVQNAGIDTDSPTEIDIYCANATSDDIDAGLGIVTTIAVPVITTGGMQMMSGTFPGTSCNYLTGFAAIVTPTSSTGATNCMCGTSSLTVESNILPVELSAFTVETASCTAILNWTSESEVNFSHYEIQRSFDGRDYTTINNVTGKGDATTSSSYDYKDNVTNVIDNNVYYRLKLVDLDGTYKLSEVEVTRFENCNKGDEFALSPNPVFVGAPLTLALGEAFLSSTGDIQIRIVDMVGKVVKEMTVDSQSSSTITIDTKNLGSGTYILQTRNLASSSFKSIKFIVFE